MKAIDKDIYDLAKEAGMNDLEFYTQVINSVATYGLIQLDDHHDKDIEEVNFILLTETSKVIITVTEIDNRLFESNSNLH
jgi:hypothetical protein